MYVMQGRSTRGVIIREGHYAAAYNVRRPDSWTQFVESGRKLNVRHEADVPSCVPRAVQLDNVEHI